MFDEHLRERYVERRGDALILSGLGIGISVRQSPQGAIDRWCRGLSVTLIASPHCDALGMCADTGHDAPQSGAPGDDTQSRDAQSQCKSFLIPQYVPHREDGSESQKQ